MTDSSGVTSTVLVIEDEAAIRRFLRAGLEGQGYTWVEASSGREGIALAGSHPPDIVLLDLGLPDLDGLQVVRRLREWSSVPIIVLTARDQERDKVLALDGGADDYVTKPFSMPELLARMRAALRRRASAQAGDGPGVVELGELVIDLVRRRVTVRGEDVRLTPIEYRLLAAMSSHPDRVLTHEHLLREVWGPAFTDQHHYLRVYVAQLRHKLESRPAHPRLLVTEPGVGYRLRGPA